MLLQQMQAELLTACFNVPKTSSYLMSPESSVPELSRSRRDCPLDR